MILFFNDLIGNYHEFWKPLDLALPTKLDGRPLEMPLA